MAYYCGATCQKDAFFDWAMVALLLKLLGPRPRLCTFRNEMKLLESRRAFRSEEAICSSGMVLAHGGTKIRDHL